MSKHCVIYLPKAYNIFLTLYLLPFGCGAHTASYLMGNRGSFPGGKRPVAELSTYFHLVLGSRMRGTILLLPNTSSWSGASLSTETNLPLPYW